MVVETLEQGDIQHHRNNNNNNNKYTLYDPESWSKQNEESHFLKSDSLVEDQQEEIEGVKNVGLLLGGEFLANNFSSSSSNNNNNNFYAPSLSRGFSTSDYYQPTSLTRDASNTISEASFSRASLEDGPALASAFDERSEIGDDEEENHLDHHHHHFTWCGSSNLGFENNHFDFPMADCHHPVVMGI